MLMQHCSTTGYLRHTAPTRKTEDYVISINSAAAVRLTIQ